MMLSYFLIKLERDDVVIYVAISVVSFCVGICAGVLLKKDESNKIRRDLQRYESLSNKHLDLYILMCLWMKKKIEGKSVAEYLMQLNIKKIAIYGCSYLGKLLKKELDESGIEITCFMDQNPGEYEGIIIKEPEETVTDVELIIVTPITFFNEIQEKLLEKTLAEVVSLQEIILLL